MVINPARRTDHITYAVRDVILVAEEARKSGRKMRYLNIGDPNQYDHRTPPHIISAVERAMRDNANGYSPSSGIPEAREAVRAEASRKGIRRVQDVFITSGASEAIEIALTSLLDEGDDLLVPSPGYPLYTAVLAKLGARENSYYLDEENGWQPDPSDIEAKITPRTRGLVLINPNNPTGSLAGRETLLAVLDIARRHGLLVISDEIYDKLVLDAAPHVSTASLAEDVPVLTCNGLSKSYVVPGWRIGWGILSGPEARLKPFDEAMNKLLRARLCAPHPAQHAVKPALEGDHRHLDELKAKLRRRRDLVVEKANAVRGISCARPEGAFYAFPRLDFPVDDRAFVSDLVRETGVVTVHGSGFGQKPGTAHFRVVLLPPEEDIRTAFEDIAAFCLRYRERAGV
jgi:alanine-synthesizing transaminase